MIDKHAVELEALINEDAILLGLKHVGQEDRDHDHRIRFKKLDECTLALAIHSEQTEEVLSCLKSNGVDAFPDEEAVSARREYLTVYIPTVHPDTDIIRYQRMLDAVD